MPFSAGITGSALIPVALVSKTGGDQIRAALVAGTPVTATIGYSQRNAGKIVLTGAADPTDSIADFTSRGGAYGATSKPDLAAPGVSIFSTSSGTGTEGQNDSGTSMATPHTAGIAALIKAAHPAYTAAQVKAALMDTAGADLYATPGRTGPLYGTSRVGAGRVQADRAVATSVLAYSTATPEGVTVSFGNVAVTAPTQVLTQTVTVANQGTAAQTYDVGYAARGPVAGATVAVSPATVTVAAGATSTVTVTLTLTRAALRHDLDPTEDRTQLGAPRQFLSEVTGLVTLGQGGAEKLRVPVYAAPRPASTVAAAAPKLTIAKPAGTATTSTTPLALTGSGVANPSTGTATTPNGITSVTSGYELAAISPALPLCSASGPSTAGGGCLRQPSQAEADLKAVGVSSTAVPADPEQGLDADRLLGFAITVQRPWKTPVDFAPFEVDIDTTGDGTPDFYVANTRVPAGLDGTDLFVADTYAIGGDTDGSDLLVDEEFLNGTDGSTDTDIFNSDTVVLPVYASVLGLTGTGRFTYQVLSGDVFNDFAGGVLDAVGPLSYAGLQPGLGLADDGSGDPLVPDAGAPALSVAYDAATFGGDAALGLLLVHHHNTDGARAETVTIANGTSTALAADTGSDTAVGQPITLTATVSKSDPTSQGGLGAGTTPVTFRDGTDVLGSVPVTGQGTAIYTVTAPTTGPHSYTATYEGNATFLPSTSAPVTTTVAQAPTTTTLTTSGSPSAAGAPVTFTAAVEQSGSPASKDDLTGTVQFRDGTTVLGSAPLTTRDDGTASAAFTTSSLALGAHGITAAYGGTATFLPSTSAALTQTVVINASTTTLVPGAGPYQAGKALPVAVTVTSPGSTTGTVTVTVDGLAPQVATLTGGTAALSLAGIPAGSHTLVATFSGNGVTATSASAAVYVDVASAAVAPVAAKPSASTIAVTGPSPVKAGSKGFKYTVTLKATDGTTKVGGRQVALYVDGVRRATLRTGASGTISYYVSFRKGTHKVTALFFGADDLTRSFSSTALTVRAV